MRILYLALIGTVVGKKTGNGGVVASETHDTEGPLISTTDVKSIRKVSSHAGEVSAGLLQTWTQ